MMQKSTLRDKQSDKDVPFWKKTTKNVPGSIRPVYGAQHPPIHHSLRSTRNTSGDKPSPRSPPTAAGSQAAQRVSPTAVSPSSPAAVMPRVGLGTNRAAANSSFSDFQQNTKDVWDLDDAEDDLSSLMTAVSTHQVSLSAKDVQSAAIAVLHNHSTNRSRHEQMGDGQGRAHGQVSPQSPPGRHRGTRPHSSLDDDVDSADIPAEASPRFSSTGSPTPGRSPGIAIRQTAGHHPYSKPSAFQQLHDLPDRELTKLDKLRQLLAQPNTDLVELRELCWSGIPKAVRANTWKLLSGYLPANQDRRQPTLQRKRGEYFQFVTQYYSRRQEAQHAETYRQIHIDIPRMNPLISLFQQECVQEMFERILFIWAIRHPASGYVQGINDLVTPFFVIFLSDLIDPEVNVENFDVTSLPENTLREMEADSYWCFSRLLDGIQDNYTFAQPGIQIKVKQMKDLVKRIDAPLDEYLETHSVEYLQFAFRWMNNLLMREFPLRCTIRLWDTYLCEPEGFASFHLYVCTSFLCRWSKDIRREKDFQGIMLLLQNLPTAHWGNEEIGLLVAEAFKLKYVFADAPNHLNKKL